MLQTITEQMFRKNPHLRQSDSTGMNKVLLLKCLPMSSGLKFKAFVMVSVLALTQSGCVDIPELDNGISKDLRHADYPKLLPIETALGPELVPTQKRRRRRCRTASAACTSESTGGCAAQANNRCRRPRSIGRNRGRVTRPGRFALHRLFETDNARGRTERI